MGLTDMCRSDGVAIAVFDLRLKSDYFFDLTKCPSPPRVGGSFALRAIGLKADQLSQFFKSFGVALVFVALKSFAQVITKLLEPILRAQSFKHVVKRTDRKST